LETNYAQFRAVGTLSILGFVPQDTLGLEVPYRIAFEIAKEKNAYSLGMTFQTVRYGCSRKENKRNNFFLFVVYCAWKASTKVSLSD